MSNLVNVVALMNSLNMKSPTDTDTDTSSLSSTTSDPEIISQFELNDTNESIQPPLSKPEPQLFELKYEGKYTDLIPYTGNYNLKEYPREKCRYECLPKLVFGKIEIKDKYNNKTMIYGTFKKKYIRVKN